jgi:hypothetical protein
MGLLDRLKQSAAQRLAQRNPDPDFNITSNGLFINRQPLLPPWRTNLLALIGPPDRVAGDGTLVWDGFGIAALADDAQPDVCHFTWRMHRGQQRGETDPGLPFGGGLDIDGVVIGDAVGTRMENEGLRPAVVVQTPHLMVVRCEIAVPVGQFAWRVSLTFERQGSGTEPATYARSVGICAEAALLVPTPPADFTHQPLGLPELEFSSVALKLMIIEELMYQQGVITPAFDREQFCAWYQGRDIDPETEPAGIIPEIFDWFATLPIPAVMGANVESFEVDGGNDIYLQLLSDQDPHTDDAIMGFSRKLWQPLITSEITDADLDQLPNLKRISINALLEPDEATLARLAARGVKVD